MKTLLALVLACMLAGPAWAGWGSSGTNLSAVGQSVTPSADNTYDLGSVAASWKTIYADTSIYSPLVNIWGTTSEMRMIANQNSATQPAKIIMYNDGSTGTTDGKEMGAIWAYGEQTDGDITGLAYIKFNGDQAATTTYTPGAMLFGTSSSSSGATEKMRITRLGYVGIGTTTPLAGLFVGDNVASANTSVATAVNNARVVGSVEVDGSVYVDTAIYITSTVGAIYGKDGATCYRCPFAAGALTCVAQGCPTGM